MTDFLLYKKKNQHDSVTSLPIKEPVLLPETFFCLHWKAL